MNFTTITNISNSSVNNAPYEQPKFSVQAVAEFIYDKCGKCCQLEKPFRYRHFYELHALLSKVAKYPWRSGEALKKCDEKHVQTVLDTLDTLKTIKIDLPSQDAADFHGNIVRAEREHSLLLADVSKKASASPGGLFVLPDVGERPISAKADKIGEASAAKVADETMEKIKQAIKLDNSNSVMALAALMPEIAKLPPQPLKSAMAQIRSHLESLQPLSKGGLLTALVASIPRLPSNSALACALELVEAIPNVGDLDKLDSLKGLLQALPHLPEKDRYTLLKTIAARTIKLPPEFAAELVPEMLESIPLLPNGEAKYKGMFWILEVVKRQPPSQMAETLAMTVKSIRHLDADASREALGTRIATIMRLVRMDRLHVVATAVAESLHLLKSDDAKRNGFLFTLMLARGSTLSPDEKSEVLGALGTSVFHMPKDFQQSALLKINALTR